MKNIFLSIKTYYQSHPKRFWVLGAIIFVAVLYSIFHTTPSTVTVYPVAKADLQSTILATGQVTSATDLSLSFSASGTIDTLPVSVGDRVSQGQIIATLNNASEFASLKSAQANYQKVVEGSSNEEIAVAQASLDSARSSLESAKKVQDNLVASAYSAMLNSDLAPETVSGSSTVAPLLSGTYTGSTQGVYTITTYSTGNGGYFSYDGIESGTGQINSGAATALGTRGLFVQFPSSDSFGTNTSWKVTIPNTKSPNYLTRYNAYQDALKTQDSVVTAAQAAVVQAQANLDLKKAGARSADLAIANAQVLAAQATYDKTIIRAPASGTVVHVDSKIGEQAKAQQEVVTIQDVGNLYVEANINETNIARVALGQPVKMTLDAFGPDTIFTGSVIHIDPSSTTADGVVNYVIKASIQNPVCKGTDVCVNLVKDKVRPGMNANMTITAWDKPDAIAVPKAAVIKESDGTTSVNVIVDDKTGEYKKQSIVTGLVGDGELIEVVSGLSGGEKIAVGAK
ncbi:MAG: efflux RND transporter periplasmic adaptor subunit [bacterium]